MIYGLIYTIPFATLDNTLCVIEIEKENYTGISTELQAADNPFTVDIEDEEFIYTPTRFSTAKISIAGSDYLQSLFSTSYREFRVTLKKDGVVTWCGYVKPELYTQDYVGETFVLEVECYSAMSVLEYLDYKVVGSGKSMITLWSLLQRCIAESRGRYNGVYIPHVYAKDEIDYNAGLNPILNMTVSEQNFFDEDNKAMTLKDVLEAICHFFNWTCVDWRGDLYFVDVDHAGTYFYYNPALESKTDITSNDLIIQNVGFAGSDNTYDRLPGYNKVSVKDSNYPVSEILPKMFGDESLKPLINTAPYYKKTDGNKFTCFSKFYTNVRFVNIFTNGDTLENVNVNLSSLGANADSAVVDNVGTLITKQSGFGWADGAPATLDWSNVVVVGMGLKDKSFSDLTGLTVFLNKEIPVMKINPDYMGDIMVSPTDEESTRYLVLSGSYFQSDTLYTDPTKPGDMSAFGTNGNACRFILKIGNKYWSGSKWLPTERSFFATCVHEDTNKVWYSWLPIMNTVTYDMGIDVEGYAIPIKKSDGLVGKIEFTVLRPLPIKYGGGGQIVRYPYYTFLKDLKLQLTQSKSEQDVLDNSTDRTYENVVNSEYINKLDEIEFKITSYNNDGACYSKVLWNGAYLTDNLWNVLLSTTKRPEEMLITRIINHYSDTRIKLTQVIKERPDLTPITRLSDNYLVNKRFIPIGGTIDYKADKFSCIMIEKE